MKLNNKENGKYGLKIVKKYHSYTKLFTSII